MRRLALDKIKEASLQKDQCVASIDRLKAEISEKPTIVSQLQQLNNTLAAHASKETAAQKTLREITDTLSVLPFKKPP